MATELERQIADLGQGDHVCPIYENLSEQMAVAVPFLRNGLAAGERCLYIADDLKVDEVVDAFARLDLPVQTERQRGSLNFLGRQEAYLRLGQFEPHAMIDFLHHVETQALADGFCGIRIVGEMTWVLGAKIDGDRLIEYEVLLNEFLKKSRSVILCQYDRSRFDPALIHDVLRTHPVAILGDLVCPNPYYEPAELVLHQDEMATSEFKRKRVDWWIARLKEARSVGREREKILERVQDLSRKLLDVQESERRHLARELHDEIGQLLTSLKLLLDASGECDIDLLKARRAQARGLIDELLKRTRQLSFDLRPAVLDQLGLLPAFLMLFERYLDQTGIRVQFKHEGLERRFAPLLETTAYRIVQEGLTNAARHAGVNQVEVQISATSETLRLQVEDQGRGFDLQAVRIKQESVGLDGMRERVLLVNGHFRITSRPGAGTQLDVELPLQSRSRKGRDDNLDSFGGRSSGRAPGDADPA